MQVLEALRPGKEEAALDPRAECLLRRGRALDRPVGAQPVGLEEVPVEPEVGPDLGVVGQVGAEHFGDPVGLVAAELRRGALEDHHRLLGSDLPHPCQGRADRLLGVDPAIRLRRVAAPVVGVDAGPVDVGVARVVGAGIGFGVVPEAVGDPRPGHVGRALGFDQVVEAPPGGDEARVTAPGVPGSVHLPPGREEERMAPVPRRRGPAPYRRILAPGGDFLERHTFAEPHRHHGNRSPGPGRVHLRIVEPPPLLAHVEHRDPLTRVPLEEVPRRLVEGRVLGLAVGFAADRRSPVHGGRRIRRVRGEHADDDRTGRQG